MDKFTWQMDDIKIIRHDTPKFEATKSFDLDRWERKALKAFKRFHAADVRFQSDAIPLPEQVRIHEALKAAETVEEVRAAFKVEEDVDSLIDSEWDAAEKWVQALNNA